MFGSSEKKVKDLETNHRSKMEGYLKKLKDPSTPSEEKERIRRILDQMTARTEQEIKECRLKK